MKIIIYSFLIFISFIDISQAQDSAAKDIMCDCAKIGDVKYSILSPDKFYLVNDSSWVLLDGRTFTETKLSSSDLNPLTSDTLPDARGLFLRGVNKGRKDNKGEVGKERVVGSYQSDRIQDHYHGIRTTNIEVPVVPKGNGKSFLNDGEDGEYNNGKIIHTNYREITGEDTRPRNIALYIYIKVN